MWKPKNEGNLYMCMTSHCWKKLIRVNLSVKWTTKKSRYGDAFNHHQDLPHSIVAIYAHPKSIYKYCAIWMKPLLLLCCWTVVVIGKVRVWNWDYLGKHIYSWANTLQMKLYHFWIGMTGIGFQHIWKNFNETFFVQFLQVIILLSQFSQ